MVYSRRLRETETAEREAAGEALWSNTFDIRALRRIGTAYETCVNAEAEKSWDIHERVARIMRLEGGWANDSVSPDELITQAQTAPLPWTLDALECIFQALKRTDKDFQAFLNMVLNEHRIAFQMIDGQVIAKSSDELHVAVVEPALRLLVGAEFAKAHGAYLAALKEVTGGEAADAITDAGTALQETLTALGCKGNALGPLLKDARRNGLLAGHDQNLVDGILKFADWASADRSESGDAHKHSTATTADAWLMAHVVGALIVRLVDPTKRGQ